MTMMLMMLLTGTSILSRTHRMLPIVGRQSEGSLIRGSAVAFDVLVAQAEFLPRIIIITTTIFIVLSS